MARNKNHPYVHPPTKNPPKEHYNVWCPLCGWHLGDSIVARKRMGEHIADKHPEDVLFKIGTEPNDFEPERISK
jgi:hypothetical protein